MVTYIILQKERKILPNWHYTFKSVYGKPSSNFDISLVLSKYIVSVFIQEDMSSVAETVYVFTGRELKLNVMLF